MGVYKTRSPTKQRDLGFVYCLSFSSGPFGGTTYSNAHPWSRPCNMVVYNYNYIIYIYMIYTVITYFKQSLSLVQEANVRAATRPDSGDPVQRGFISRSARTGTAACQSTLLWFCCISLNAGFIWPFSYNLLDLSGRIRLVIVGVYNLLKPILQTVVLPILIEINVSPWLPYCFATHFYFYML